MNENMDRAALRPGDARLNVTFDGRNADLVEPVPFGASDAQIKEWAREAILGGALGGHGRAPVDLRAFVVDRFPASVTVPVNRVFVRPSTPFG